MSVKNKRDASIEAVRIVASMIVVAVHVSNWYESGNVIDRSSLIIRAFLQDAVPMFWYIMGMYLFSKGTPFKKVLVRTLKGVLLPAVCVIMAFQVLEPWLQSKQDFLTTLMHPQFDAREVFGGILSWNSSMALSGHLWYVFSYVKVVLWYPVLSLVCRDTPAAARVRRYMLLLCLIMLAVEDVQQFYVLPVGKVVPYSLFSESMMYVVIGYELSLVMPRIRSLKAARWIGLALFVAANLYRAACTGYFFGAGQRNTHFMNIKNINSIVSSLGLFIFISSVRIKNEKCRNLILRGGGYTFLVYLLHRGVYEKLNTLGLRSRIFALGSGWLSECLALILYAAIVYAVTWLVSAIVKNMGALCKAGIRCVKKRPAVQTNQKSSL